MSVMTPKTALHVQLFYEYMKIHPDTTHSKAQEQTHIY